MKDRANNNDVNMSTANFKGISKIHTVDKDDTDLSDINISNLNQTQNRKSDHKLSGSKHNSSKSNKIGFVLDINLDSIKKQQTLEFG